MSEKEYKLHCQSMFARNSILINERDNLADDLRSSHQREIKLAQELTRTDKELKRTKEELKRLKSKLRRKGLSELIEER